jgi:heat shock protein HslJ
MNQSWRFWVSRSLAIAIAVGSGQQVLAHNQNAYPVSTVDSTSSNLIVAMPNALENLTAQLVSYRAADGSTVDAFSEREATFRFEDGRVTGTTGCNRFFSSYSREGDQLTITPGGSTLMACIDETLAAQESAILGNLPQVNSYVQTDAQLLLLDGEGTTLFTLMPQPTAELIGPDWQLTVYNNGRGGLTTPILDTTITAQFDGKGNVAGSAGCNRYRATFATEAETLSIGPAASTRRLCPEPEGIMEQELTFLALLENVVTYSISGNQLDLKNAEGTSLARFTAEL